MGFREARHANVKSSIIQKAIELVEKSGASKLSARSLATAIEYSPAALYEYFSGKDDLLNEVKLHGHGLLASYMGQARTEATPHKKAMRLGLEYLKFAREHTNLYQLMFDLNKNERKDLQTQMPADSAYGILIGVLSELGLDSNTSIEDLAYSYWGLVHGMASLELYHLKDFDADFLKAQNTGIECFLKGVEAN